uniref:Na_H_Exchanger domain-containing protein n=1 Tax=Ascaris lumbricoides TaxID=6252 RepID=A0A0M3HK88_ASCLU
MVLTSAILVYILIGAFAIPMPQFANGILFIIEFGACLLLIVALSSERWHFVVPFIAAEIGFEETLMNLGEYGITIANLVAKLL